MYREKTQMTLADPSVPVLDWAAAERPELSGSHTSGVPDSLGEIYLRISKISDRIRVFGDPVLRKIAESVSCEDMQNGTAYRLAEELARVLLTVSNTVGVGRAIAAPQIGVSKRIVVFIESREPLSLGFLLNPRITFSSPEKNLYSEMCLSFLPIAADVVRPASVEIEYQDLHGRLRKMNPVPIISRLLQHEIDHLDGVLLPDRAKLETMRVVSNLNDYKQNTRLVRI